MKYRILSLYIFILILSCKKESSSFSSQLDYIPQNASIIIKVNNYQNFKATLASNNFLNSLKTSKAYIALLKKINALQYLEIESESILAFSILENEEIEFTFITHNHSNLLGNDTIQNKIIEQLDYKNSAYKKYEVDDSSFYTLLLNDNLIISSSELLLNSTIENSGKNLKPQTLQKLYKIANDAKPATIFIDLDQSDPFVFSWMKDNVGTNIAEFSDWASLDIDINDEYINLNGISIANDSLKNYLNLFKNSKPLTNSTPYFAPIEADAILSYTFDSHQIFAKNQKEFSELSAPVDSLLNTIEEIGFIYLKNQKAILLNTYGAENITEYLTGIRKRTFDYQGNEIIELTEVDFLNKRLNPIVKDFTTNFCTIIEDAFVFTENIESLQTIIRNYKNGNTFNKSAVYKSAMKKLAEESTILFISNSNNIELILKNRFSEGFYKDIKELATEKYSYAAQAIADKNFYHTNIIVQKIEKENKTTKVAPLFSVKLDTEIANEPQFVTNHLTNRKEIVVQDMNNKLYLISHKGKILWKKELTGSIQGEIKQVDIFKNGRLQLAFTTSNQFLVLDRNGKEVAQFTKTYDGGNLNPLAVFDYDGKKNYRFVVTQGEKIFMYNSKASIVDGFKYTKAEKPIVSAPKHMRIGKKDFLVFKLEDGSLKILNRVGNLRTKVNDKIDFSENEVFLYKNKFTLTDKKGILYQIDEKGKITKTNLNLSNDHGIYATGKTLAVMNDNILSIRGKQVELELGVYTQPKIFYIYDKIYIAVTDLQHQKIYMFDSQAKPIPNFPVFGTSTIDLTDVNNDKKLEFVTKNQNNSLLIYQIN